MRVEFELSLSRAYHHKDHNLLGFVITLSLLTCLLQTSHLENFNNLVNRYKRIFRAGRDTNQANERFDKIFQSVGCVKCWICLLIIMT